MKFEWDSKKEKQNRKKHKLPFSAAMDSFKDLYRIEMYDEEHSSFFEKRYKTIDRAPYHQMLITTSFTYRNGSIRIISARPATKEEEEEYYDYQ